ncbi:MAG: hypothetical protein AB1353_02175 [Aquificota bacterium]
MQEETIYDYMSEEELLDWFYPGVQREVREKYNLKIPTREEYIQSTTPTQRIFDLYRLGLNRRDKEFAKKYFDMLETPKKYAVLYRDCFGDDDDAKEWEELVDYLTDGKPGLVVK